MLKFLKCSWLLLIVIKFSYTCPFFISLYSARLRSRVEFSPYLVMQCWFPVLLELNQIIRNQSGFIYEVSIGEFYFAWITNAFNYTCECNSAMKRKYILKTLLIQYDIKSRNILKQLLKPYSLTSLTCESLPIKA